MKRLRILYFCTMGTLSRRPLATLLASGLDVVGVVMPTDRVPPFQLAESAHCDKLIGHLPIQPIITSQSKPNLLNGSPSPLELAAQFQIPAFALADLMDQESHERLRALSPDVICVSCFPHLLPNTILQIPRLGCLNIHPSLLPRFRGPAPIFWTFRYGVQKTGVTVHLMDEQFDTGDVLGQWPYTLPNGITEPEVEQALGKLGGELLVNVLHDLKNGSAVRQPQLNGYTADSWPTNEAFELNISWTAQRAFNFVRGTMAWQRPFFVIFNKQRIWLKEEIFYEEVAFKQFWEQLDNAG